MAKVKKQSDKPTELEKDLLEGMKQIAAHVRGEVRLPAYRYAIDEDIDVKKIRQSLDVTQEQFAKLIGASVSAVRHWENGRRKPRGTASTLLHVIKENPAVLLTAFTKRVA